MKRWICFALAVCFIATLAGVSQARVKARPIEMQTGGSKVEDEYINYLGQPGAMWFPNISTKGYIGYYDISAYYPGGGDQSTVWQAGLWAGGYVWSDSLNDYFDLPWLWQGQDGAHSDPATYDALDLEPILEDEYDFDYPYPYRRLTVEVNTGTKPLEIADRGVIDGDMGMTVTFEWHSWGVREYDNWVFLKCTIDFSKDVKDFWWGFSSDCDIGDVGLADYYFDDYAGWDEAQRYCYMRDWDYDPVPYQPPAASVEDSLFQTPNVIAQVLLAAPLVGGDITADPSDTQRWVTKNYWDWNNDYSTRQDAYERLNGDWENPFDSATDFEYRILNAVGPYDAKAGDQATFWFAYVMGEGYKDEDHATFNLGTVDDHVSDAYAFYSGGMAIPTSAYAPQAPDLDPDLEVDVRGAELTVDWTGYTNLPSPGLAAEKFNVFKSTDSKLGPWVLDQTLNAGVTSTIVDLVPGFYTYVWVEAYNETEEAGSNPYALTSRVYEADVNGVIRANENTIVGVIGATEAASDLSEVTVAPNPYVGSNEAELTEYETLLGFHNLPAKCNIYIYTLLGNLVDVVYHDSESGSEFWDMTTRTDEAIASGLYVYRITTEDGQEKIGKFSVMKGQR